MTLAALLVVGTSLATTIPRPAVVAAPLEAIQSSQAMAASPSIAGPAATRDGYTVTEAKKQAVAAGISVADTYINNPTGAVQWPFPVGVPISDYFGPRSSPGGIGSTDHKGVDFTPGQGAPIGAVADGVVRLVQATDQGGLGVHVVIDHVIDGQNVSSWYGHMLTGSPTVEEGQVVVAGQQIGSVGNTGVSTGAHTHLEIHVGSTPVDPYAFISSRN
jgi:murein DD-endopeptidase MepM/ murein hydrolase activator NlpD